MLALDVDGTVLTSGHEISNATASAIQRASAAGIDVVLATGRRYRDVLPVAGALELTGPLVTASGALIKEPLAHGTLFRGDFPAGLLELVLGMVDAAGHEAVVYTDSFAEGFDFHCRGLDVGTAGLQEYLARNSHLARVEPRLHERPPAAAFAAFSMGSEEAMRALEAGLRENFEARLSLHVIRSPRYGDWLCEIAPAGVTKWTGIERLARERGIDPGGICAVGDDANDLPMIRAAGLGVAMGNGTREVQEAADLVAGGNDEDGLAALLEELLALPPDEPVAAP